MKKKSVMLIALAMVVALTALCLVACNNYKWTAVGGDDSTQNSVSNGGQVVEHGNYVYFVNGYAGADADNTFGTPVKQSIMRCAKNADGTYDNATASVIVPKSVYQTPTKSGFAIFGNWIYYATPNTEKDSSGAASTTHTDFMRTSLDGSITQLIATINSREADILYTPSRIVYYLSSNIYYIDFSGMKTTKSISDGKGAYSGTLLENVTSYFWSYDAEYAVSQGAEVTDYVFYTKAAQSSADFYNTLNCVRFDGSDARTLVTYTTYLPANVAAADYVKYPQNVFNLVLKGGYVDDANTVTLYYTKAANIGGTSTVTGFYQNKFALIETSENGMKAATERQLSTTAPSSFTALGYSKGVLFVDSASDHYLVDAYRLADGSFKLLSDDSVIAGRSATCVEENLVLGGEGTYTVQFVRNINNADYVFYTDSTGTALYRINLVKANGASPNAASVAAIAKTASSLDFEMVGTTFFYVASDDYDYIHYFDVADYDGTALTSTLLGKYNTVDQASYDAAHAED